MIDIGCKGPFSLSETARALRVGQKFLLGRERSEQLQKTLLLGFLKAVAARKLRNAPHFPQPVVLAVIVNLIDVYMRAHGAISPILSSNAESAQTGSIVGAEICGRACDAKLRQKSVWITG
jgi:hypothetical protein